MSDLNKTFSEWLQTFKPKEYNYWKRDLIDCEGGCGKKIEWFLMNQRCDTCFKIWLDTKFCPIIKYQ